MERLTGTCVPPGMRYVICLTPKAYGRKTELPLDVMKRVAAI